MAHDARGLLPAEEPIQLLTIDGTALTPAATASAEHRYAMPADDEMLAGYRDLVIGRRVNEQAGALARQGRLAVYPSSHGQEACQVAAGRALRAEDWLFPTYRDSVSVMTRGIAPADVLVLFQGVWHNGYDTAATRTATLATPLATQLLHAVGVAHAAKLRGEDTVAIALCGDGATSEGDFHEALNFAAVFKVGVIFLIQNNEYAISVPLSKQTVAPSIAHKAIGYGMPGERVDGNDLAALLAVLGSAVDRARNGGGPALIEAHTYRMEAHTNADDATRYRSAAEVAQWAPRDPLLRLEKYLHDAGTLGSADAARFAAAAEVTAKQLRDGLNAPTEPDPQDMFRFVFSEPTAQLQEQGRQLAAELAAASTEGGRP